MEFFMISDEKMTEWRDIWQEIIETSRLTLIEETQRIMNAQASRGVDLDNGSLKEKLMAILSLIVPLFISAFDRADQLANAMEARGYNPNAQRTRYKVLKMSSLDYIGLISSGFLLILNIAICFVL